MAVIAKRNPEYFLEKYIENAPLCLALMRSLECAVMSQAEYERPVLDIGCGEGLFASVLFRDYVDIGIDIDKREAGSARKRGIYRQVIVADVSHIPLREDSVGTVYSNCVLEHLPDVKKVFEEAERVLRKGGQIVFTAADKDFSRLLFLSAFFERIGLKRLSIWYAGLYDRVFRHRQRFNKAEWGNLLEDAGFKILDSGYYFPPDAVRAYGRLLPFSAIAFVTKKVLGRWVISPSLRRKLLTGFGRGLFKKYYCLSTRNLMTGDRNAGEVFIRAVKV